MFCSGCGCGGQEGILCGVARGPPDTVCDRLLTEADLPARETLVSVNVADTVRHAARSAAEAPALVGSRGVVTWGSLDAGVDAVAAALRARNLPASAGAPARVVIALPQSPEFAEVFFGVLRAGLVAVPVNPGYTPREMRHVLADSSAAAVVAIGQAATAIASERADAPMFTPSDLRAPAGPVEATGAGEDLAVLLYTSGSSGAPKGAMLPHRALLANQRQVASMQPPPIGPEDIVLLALPSFHIFGLNAGLIAVAYHGACGVLVDRFDPVETLAAIATNRVSVVGAVPQMYAAWLSAPSLAASFASVRVAVSGGAPLAAEVALRFQAVTGKAIRQGYGLTETAPVLTMGLESPAPKATSIGRPVPGVAVRLVAGDGSVVASLTSAGLQGAVVPSQRPADVGDSREPTIGQSVDDDAFEETGTDPGEIVVRGENLFRGYWPDGHAGPDASGWWPTGDVAYADADGDLFLVDRLVDLIIVNGFNVYPQEVEHVLLAHPGVAEAAVVGVPDAVTGEAVHAFVVPAGGGASFEELLDHCGRNLARYKCPASFEIVDQLPRSAIGKVRKGSLRHPSPEAVA